MRIEEHPFYVLGITARTAKREVLERAERLEHQAESQRVNALRIQVTHPVKRLEAELSWFPGLAPAKIRNVIASVQTDPDLPATFQGKFPAIDRLGRLNAIVYWLSAPGGRTSDCWDFALADVANAWCIVDPSEVIGTINGDRAVAGIPEVTDLSSVESALARLQGQSAASIADVLIESTQPESVLARAIEREVTEDSAVSDFLAHIIDRYQIHIQPTLDHLTERLSARTEIVFLRAENLTLQRDQPNLARLSTAIDDLGDELGQWRTVARPIQLLMKSRGLKDTRSIEVAKSVRGMSVKTANDLGLHEDSQRITYILYEAFQDVPEVAELLEQDLDILDGIVGASHSARSDVDQGQLGFEFEESATSNAAALPEGSSEQDKTTHHDGAGSSGSAVPITDLSLSEADTAKALEIFRTHGEEGLRRFLQTAYSHQSPAEQSPTEDTSDADGTLTARAFVQLCRLLRLECWQRVDPQDSDRMRAASLFRDAYRDYERKASPWLGIICDTHGDNTTVVMQVRNAAAECLNSLATGLVCAGEFDTAQRLCMQALPLIFDDEKLEADVKKQLEFIASEKEKLGAPSTSRQGSSAPRGNTRPTATASNSSPRLRPQTGSRTPFQLIKDSPNRSRFIIVGLAVLIGIPLLIFSITGPQWQPQVMGSGPTGQVRAEPTPAPPPPHDPVSLRNGTNLIRQMRAAGLGTLKISNQTRHDAAVKLKTLNGPTVRFIYITAMSEATLSKISPGEYKVQFVTGRDWDETGRIFREELAFAAFDETLSFSDDGQFYSVYEITLHTVPNGNVRRRAISADEFGDDTVGGGSQ